jgi:GNAT superfamily N-acetyltransferase
MIKNATYQDLAEIDALAVRTIEHMALSNIPQWTLAYPRLKHYKPDINQEALYIYKEESKIIGAMTILPENDPPYQTISGWKKEKSLVIHRVIVDPNYQHQGVAQKLMDYAKKMAKDLGYESIKIDTHLKNYKMRRFLEKNHFVEIGYLAVIDRQAYEYVLGDKK